MSTRAQEYDNYLDYLDDYIVEKAEKRAVDQERASPPDPLDREEAEQANDETYCDQCARAILGEVWVTMKRGRVLCYRCWEECDEVVAYRRKRWFHRTFAGSRL